jgi:hypothetical protein
MQALGGRVSHTNSKPKGLKSLIHFPALTDKQFLTTKTAHELDITYKW